MVNYTLVRMVNVLCDTYNVAVSDKKSVGTLEQNKTIEMAYVGYVLESS